MKKIFLFIFSLITIIAVANEFTIPKKQNLKKVSAKKIKENSLEQIGDIFKLLIELERELLNVRSCLQDDFESGIYGDSESCINSSSKMERQKYLDALKELHANLSDQVKIVKSTLKKINSKNSLKG